MTLVSDIDEEIAPSVTGLSNLYRWLASSGPRESHPLMRLHCDQPTQIALIFYVLSGLTIDTDEQDSTSSSPKSLALAGAGVCVYRQALEDPNLPPDSIFRIRVVSGYISHAGTIFKRIRNLSGQRHDFTFDTSTTYKSVNAVVQETDRDFELAMAYQLDLSIAKVAEIISG